MKTEMYRADRQYLEPTELGQWHFVNGLGGGTGDGEVGDGYGDNFERVPRYEYDEE